MAKSKSASYVIDTSSPGGDSTLEAVVDKNEAALDALYAAAWAIDANCLDIGDYTWSPGTDGKGNLGTSAKRFASAHADTLEGGLLDVDSLSGSQSYETLTGGALCAGDEGDFDTLSGSVTYETLTGGTLCAGDEGDFDTLSGSVVYETLTGGALVAGDEGDFDTLSGSVTYETLTGGALVAGSEGDFDTLSGSVNFDTLTGGTLSSVTLADTRFEVEGGQSRDISLDTDWTISGLGGTPKAIFCMYGENSTARGGWGIWASDGGDFGEYFGNSAQFSYGAPLVTWYDGTNTNSATVSAVADGSFTLDWTKASSPVGTVFFHFLIFY